MRSSPGQGEKKSGQGWFQHPAQRRHEWVKCCQKSIYVFKTHKKSICLLAWRSADLKTTRLKVARLLIMIWIWATMIIYFKLDAAEAEDGDEGAMLVMLLVLVLLMIVMIYTPCHHCHCRNFHCQRTMILKTSACCNISGWNAMPTLLFVSIVFCSFCRL